MLALQILTVSVCCAVVPQVVSAPNNAPAQLPPNLQRCKKLDPNLPECLKTAIQTAIPEFINGVPSLGISSLDPLEMKKLLIQKGEGPVSLKLDLEDLLIYGISSAVITSFTPDLNLFSLNFTAELGKPITVDGKCNVNGKVLIMPVTGSGKCKFVLEGFKARIIIKGRPIIKDGSKFMDVETFKFQFSTTKLRINVANLFNGDKALGNNMNVFLNENWSAILKELQPGFEDAFSQEFLEMSNKVFLKVPFDDIFLD